jgi:hypothetical protein
VLATPQFGFPHPSLISTQPWGLFPQMKRSPRAHILGIGFDNADGHKRITRADQFSVVGGSEETHERITETLLKTCDDLRRKGKSIDQAEPRELTDLLHKNQPD